MSIDQTEKVLIQSVENARNPIRRWSASSRYWISLQLLRWQVKRERRALARLPDNLLADMGIDRAEALRESRRSLMDIPARRIHHQLGRYWLIDLD